MRKGGGKAKGSQFERDICRQLSLWVSQGAHEDVFWRSAMSGGRSTVAAAKGKRLSAQAGDISCVHPAGHLFAERFLAECKFYADLNYVGLLTAKGHLAQFWSETVAEADLHSKMPFLIAKQNRQPTTICLSIDGLMTLGIPATHSLLIVPAFNLYILDADKFFADTSPPVYRQRIMVPTK